MEIHISAHAREQALARGVAEQEIREALERGHPIPAHSGRLGLELVVPYRSTWGRRGRYYEQKRIAVYFRVEDGIATVVTVISQFGSWEK